MEIATFFIVLLIVGLLISLGIVYTKYIGVNVINRTQFELIKSHEELDTEYKKTISEYQKLITTQRELIELNENMIKNNNQLIEVLRLKEGLYLESLEEIRVENEGLHNRVTTLTDIIRTNEYR